MLLKFDTCHIDRIKSGEKFSSFNDACQWLCSEFGLEKKDLLTCRQVKFLGKIYQLASFATFIDTVVMDRYQQLSKDQTYRQWVNVGAADGCSNIPVLNKVEEIINIEPHPEFFNLCEKNFPKAININKALTDRKGDLTLQLIDDGDSPEILEQKIISHAVAGDSLNLKPDIIKIDAAGFEGKVLEGFAATISVFRPKILLANYFKGLDELSQCFQEVDLSHYIIESYESEFILLVP